MKPTRHRTAFSGGAPAWLAACPALAQTVQPTVQVLIVDETGRVAVGQSEPTAPVDVMGSRRAGTLNPDGAEGPCVTDDFDADRGVEFRRSGGSQGIGFGDNTISATGADEDQPLRLRARGSGTVTSESALNVIDERDEARSGEHRTANKGHYVTGVFGSADDIEFRHSNGTQGFGFDTIYATGSNANQLLRLRPRGDEKITSTAVFPSASR